MTDNDAAIVVLDQFFGPTPHALAQTPMLWRDFLLRVERGDYNSGYRTAERTTLAELDKRGQHLATTAYRCGASGYVEIWRMHWDSGD